ncbi:MAG: hypothetical protein J0I06_22825 [Planctomycetes bacterium]|nr:hypothetical protein [Planctomycetota bacterium]
MPNGRQAAAAKQEFTAKLEKGDVNIEQTVFAIDDDHLSDWDRIASYILACVYSSVQRQHVSRQSYSSADTVAVARSGSTLHVFTNTMFARADWNKQQQQVVFTPLSASKRGTGQAAAAETVFAAMKEAGMSDIKTIDFTYKKSLLTNRTYHAEMQCVDYFFEERQAIDGNYIGVSKPCCRDCAKALDKFGIGYAYWHDVSGNNDWVPPRPMNRWF